MKFNNVEELLEFFNNEVDWELSHIVLKEKEDKCDCGKDPCECEECDCGKDPCECDKVTESAIASVDLSSVLPESAIVESFSDTPSFRILINEDDQNIFYVKDFTTPENRDTSIVGSGTVVLEDRVCNMNMRWDSTGNPVVNLTIKLGDMNTIRENFILQITDKAPYLELSEKLLS